jgi:hypothetical protein
MPDATADNTSLLNQAHVQYQGGTRGSTVEKPAETQTSIQLASHLVRAPNSWPGGHEFEFPVRIELGALTIVGRPLGSGLPAVVTLTWSCHWCSQFGTSLADSHAWQAHLPDATADNTSLLNQPHVQYQHGALGTTVEKPAETQTSIRLASHLVRAPNSWSGGHEFEYPGWIELDALTEGGMTLGVRSSHTYKDLIRFIKKLH